MKKIAIKPEPNFLPMPIVIVGVKIEGKPNFLTVSFVGMMNYAPPVVAISIGKGHLSQKGIENLGVFSINVPSAEMVKKTDYIGTKSGAKVEKDKLFDWFYGTLKEAPMITEAPVNLECKVIKKVDLEKNRIYIAEIEKMYSSEEFLTKNQLDHQKIKPMLFTMPDRNYWALQTPDKLGKAWSIGLNINENE